MQKRAKSVLIKGRVLRSDRRAKFRSVEAFAEICATSAPTIRRAEQGGRISIASLSAIATALGEPVGRYLAESSLADALIDIRGDWSGYLIAADQRLDPYIVEEKISFTVAGNKVTGFGGADTPQGYRVKRFEHCHIEANVFLGTVKIEDWGNRPCFNGAYP